MRRPRRVFVRLLCGLCPLLAASALLAWWSWMPGALAVELAGPQRALPAPFRTWAEHDAIYGRDDEPFVLDLGADGGGALCYVGVFHSTDAGHAHRVAIADHWRRFRPTVALCEGRARGHFTRWPFSRLPQGEPALVHALARADGVPIHSLEPPYEREVEALLEVATTPQVAMFLTLRVYWSEAGGVVDEALFADLLDKRTDVPALRHAVADLAAADAVWAPLRSQHGDWRTRTDAPQGTWLAALGERSRLVRGEHMVRLLLDLTSRGERVFAVVGRSHVIRHEPVLRAVLGG